jgi:hypothetical protein
MMANKNLRSWALWPAWAAVACDGHQTPRATLRERR